MGFNLEFELFDKLAGALLVVLDGRKIDLTLRRSLDLLLDFDRHGDLICSGCETLAWLIHGRTSVRAGPMTNNDSIRPAGGAAAATKPSLKGLILISNFNLPKTSRSGASFSEHPAERSEVM